METLIIVGNSYQQNLNTQTYFITPKDKSVEKIYINQYPVFSYCVQFTRSKKYVMFFYHLKSYKNLKAYQDIKMITLIW